MEQSTLVPMDIIILAVLAGFLVFQLYRVLGQRTGHQRPHRNPYSDKRNADMGRDSAPTPVAAGTTASAGTVADNADSIDRAVGKDTPLAGALTEIQIADRTFDVDGFVEGAKRAYEMIVMAFANGDRKELKPLLSPDVYEGFEAAITAREEAGHTVETNFVGIKSAEIVDAAMNGSDAEVTISFVSELISHTRDNEGHVVEGDPNQVVEIKDIWTFARDTRDNDPNWQLIGTDAG